MDDLTVGIDAISAGTTLAAGGQVVFSNSNNITFGLTGRTVTASAAAAGVTAVSGLGVSTLGNTSGDTGTTIGTIVLAGINHITLSQSTAVNAATITISGRDAIFGAGVSTGGNTSGTTGTQTGTLVLAGGNNITLSQATDPSGLTVTISGVSQSTGPAAIAAGTQTATSGTIVFSNSNNVTFGMQGSSVVTASIGNVAATVSAWSHNAEWISNWVAQHGILSLQRVVVPVNVSASSALFAADLRAPVGLSGAMSLSMGIYTFTGGTASLLTSSSGSTSWTSGAATTASSVYGGQSGTRYRPIDFSTVLPPGDYLVGVHLLTENAGTWRVFGRQGMSLVEHLALPSNVTQNFLDGVSTSSFSTALPSSVIITDTGYNRTGQSALRQPGFILLTA